MSVHNDNTSLNAITSDHQKVRHTINFLSKKLVKEPLKKGLKRKNDSHNNDIHLKTLQTY